MELSTRDRVALASYTEIVEGRGTTNGAASSGLHGANRLGGNSLIELLVYGSTTGAEAAEYALNLSSVRRSSEAVAEARAGM